MFVAELLNAAGGNAMSKIIYVPQGYSARLTKEQMLLYDISGLFTDGFSSCNIVAVISKETLILMHIDTSTLNSPKMLKQMQHEIEGVNEPREIIVAFRNVEGGGRNVNVGLLTYFDSQMPFAETIKKDIDDETQGIALYFNAQKPSDIHANIQKFSLHVRPEGLIHHPQEQQFLAVQKIEQIIGQQERLLTGVSKNKQFCIFNEGWEVLRGVELKVDTSHPLTMNEMLLFSREDTYPHIIKKLMKIINDSGVPYRGDMQSAVVLVAPYLEEYLSNYKYDYISLFKRGLKQMVVLMKHSKPQSKADKDFEHDIIRLLDKNDNVFDEAKQIVEKYKQQAPETEMKEMMVGGYTAFAQHYQDRKYYYELKQSSLELIKLALSYNDTGIRNYKEKNYKLATSALFEVIRLYLYCCVKSEPNLATTYYNYGQSLGKDGDYHRAAIFIKIAFELRENYTQPKPVQQELEKTRAALNTYEEKLKRQSVSVSLAEILDLSQNNKPLCSSTNNSVNEDKKLYSQGMQLYRAGDYTAALNCFQQELINQQKTKIILPNIETTTLNFNIGSVYMKTNKPMSALPYLQAAFDIREQLLGPNDERTLKAKGRLQECKMALNSTSQTLIFSVHKPEGGDPELTLNSTPAINRFRANQE